MKPKQHPAHTLTKHERIDIIRHVLRPCAHRGKLHIPKDTYFETGGLEQLANEVMYWLGHKNLQVSVELVDASTATSSNWHSAVTESGGIITIDKRLWQTSPFIAAYYTVLGVLQLIIWRYNHTTLNPASQQKLLDHMSIEAGFGIYGINAAFQPTVETPLRKNASAKVFQSISTDTYVDWFFAYTTQHRIQEVTYEQCLLPKARKELHIAETANDPAEPAYISQFQKQLHRKYEILSLIALVGILLMALLALLFPLIPRAFNSEQQRLVQQAQELQTAHETCQAELEDLSDSITTPDILNRQSLRAKHNACEQLRFEYNAIVNQLKDPQSNR